MRDHLRPYYQVYSQLGEPKAVHGRMKPAGYWRSFKKIYSTEELVFFLASAFLKGHILKVQRCAPEWDGFSTRIKWQASHEEVAEWLYHHGVTNTLVVVDA